MRQDLEELLTDALLELPLVQAIEKVLDIVYDTAYHQGYVAGLSGNKVDGNTTKN